MTGHKGPTRREMEDRLVKRIISVGESELYKRYNRQRRSRLEGRFNRQGMPGHRKGQGVPGLTKLQSLADLDGLPNLKGEIPDELLSQFTGNQG
jgi:hypothetical protein